MNIKRDEMTVEDLEAIFGPQDIPRPDVFDLSAEVVLGDLTDDELLFRESVIKTFFENATRAGHPVYGFTVETLERLHKEVVQEFKKRGRDYQPALDRHQKEETKDIKRSVKDDEITVKEKTRDEQMEELVEKAAQKAADKVAERDTVTIPWGQSSPNYPGSGNIIYCGTNYTSTNNAGGDIDDKETS